ncbi:hypothetical protein AVEN_94237-1 [Araneus ventricosus]|uniref:Uncharacterized protein n=1 Tax=Araneus ventricosus TaxID=182803 RepID=A0A4Y2S4Q4_ARAVE|nr:hypothetical protein AVEN_94237-1 [Araneus ventricosus]
MNGRPFMSHLSPKGPFNDHSPSCLLPLSEQQPAEIRPTSIEVAWPVTAGLGVRVLKEWVVQPGHPIVQSSEFCLRPQAQNCVEASLPTQCPKFVLLLYYDVRRIDFEEPGVYRRPWASASNTCAENRHWIMWKSVRSLAC